MNSAVKRIIAPWHNPAEDVAIQSKLDNAQRKLGEVTSRAKAVAKRAENVMVNTRFADPFVIAQ